MTEKPLSQLSPELVLILPPEVAAIARMTLAEPDRGSPPRPRRAGRRRTLRRALGLASIYAAVLVLTGTPLALAMRAVPAHGEPQLRVDHQLRAHRNDAH
jgi:hypothetical protein